MKSTLYYQGEPAGTLTQLDADNFYLSARWTAIAGPAHDAFLCDLASTEEGVYAELHGRTLSRVLVYDAPCEYLYFRFVSDSDSTS